MKNMLKIEIPEVLRNKLGPEMEPNTHWIDVKLIDGRLFRNLVVQEGRYITGSKNDSIAETELSFASRDIFLIRRHSVLPFW